jgi:hypothetical protein
MTRCRRPQRRPAGHGRHRRTTTRRTTVEDRSELPISTRTMGVQAAVDNRASSNPLRGRPHGDEHGRKDDDDLAPKYFGRGHDDPGSGVACPKSKYRISSGVRTATAGYDSAGRGCRRTSVIGGNPEYIYSSRAFRILTRMYGPAVRCKRFSSSCRFAVLHQCIRPLIGAFAPGHHGYQRVCVLISGQASSGGPFGSPVFACAGKTDPPSLLILSQTSAGNC